jgi:predicted dehydrogenase
MRTRIRPDRRAFLQSSSLILGTAALGRPAAPRDEVLHVALIGCGGRGTGAAAQALATAGEVRLVSVADAFQDRIDTCLAELEKAVPGRLAVPPERRFVGFDAYRGALDCDVDVAILATPPGFRPQHFAYAIEKGRHLFVEKPLAVDGPGVRSVLESARRAREKGLKIGVGLQRRHENRYVETVRRIREGALGDLLYYRCYWNSGGVWVHPRVPGSSEMEYQMRNWYYFNWLSGDHIVEQHIHNIDVCNWIQGGHPVEAQGQGGRQVRTGPEYGEIYDHHAVEFRYQGGARAFSQCRHIENTWSSVSEHAHGTLGSADVGAGVLRPHGREPWLYEGEDNDPYQSEHDELFRAIRQDLPHDESQHGAESTLTAILGRMASYSGRVVTWEEALGSELALAPSAWSFEGTPPSLPDADGRYPIPIPGVSRAF